MESCAFATCAKEAKSRGYCDGHYRQLLRGDSLHPLKTTRLGTLEERVWDRTNRTGDCWTWTGSIDNYGYGSLRFGGKTLKAHRVSYEIAFGVISDGLVIDHKCHTRSCVRPDHLQAVTQKQNLENIRNDARSKTRGVHRQSKSERWFASVSHHGQRIYVGSFASAEEANEAVVAKRMELFTNNLDDRRKHVS